jgi:hypothetical protein
MEVSGQLHALEKLPSVLLGRRGEIWSERYGVKKNLSLLGIETRLFGLQPVFLLLYRLSYPGSLLGRGDERKIFVPWRGAHIHPRSHWVSGIKTARA